MQRATLGKGSFVFTRSDSESSNSLVKTMEMTAVFQYILTAAQSFGSQDYYKKSRMTTLRLAGVLFG